MCSVFYVGENMIQKMKHLTQEIDKEAEKVKLEAITRLDCQE